MQEFFINYGLWLLIALLVLIGLIFLLSGRKGSAATSADSSAPVEKAEVIPPAAAVQAPVEPTPPVSAAAIPEAAPAAIAVEPAPQSVPLSPAVTSIPAGSDDLLRLKGVGPKLNALLLDLGVTSYAQIAQWSDTDIAAIDGKLGNFKGRPVRDQWVDQAKYLAAGDIAGFEAKYGKV